MSRRLHPGMRVPAARATGVSWRHVRGAGASSGEAGRGGVDVLGGPPRRDIAAYCDHVLAPLLLRAQAGGLAAHRWQELRADVARALDHLDDIERLRSVLSPRASARDDAASMTAPRSVVPCLGMGHPAEELAAALLVRLLRARGVDARHLRTRDDLDALPSYGIARSSVRTVCLVSLNTPDAREHGLELAESAHWLLPHARVFGLLLLAGRTPTPRPAAVAHLLDEVATSFGEVVRRVASVGSEPDFGAWSEG